MSSERPKTLDEVLVFRAAAARNQPIGTTFQNTRGAAESRLNCCRVSAETARFAGRDPEALDRVGDARQMDFVRATQLHGDS